MVNGDDNRSNVLRGRIWVLVVATVLLGAIIGGKLMRRSHQTDTPTTLG